MKFFQKILLASALACSLIMGHAFAVEADTPAAPDPVVTAPDDSGTDDTSLADDSYPDDDGSAPVYMGGGSVTCSGSDVKVEFQKHDTLSVASVSDVSTHQDTAPDSLSGLIRSLFGSYEPRTQTVTTYYDGKPISSEEQIIPGLGGLDWEWIAGVLLFALVLFCLFRLLGGIMTYG